MQVLNHTKIKSHAGPFKMSQVIIPMTIGLLVIAWLFISEFDPKTFDGVLFNFKSLCYLLLAFMLIFTRDFGMIWRFRLMTNSDLTWRRALNVHILNEFTSAVTPSAVGGSALIVLFMSKEGISVGRSTAIMITNLFLDELFFILICPIIFFVVPLNELFNATSVITTTIGVVFWSVYGLLVFWTLILYIGLFLRPDLIAQFARFVFKLRFLRRWQKQVDVFAESIVSASHAISHKSISFWLKAFGVTTLSWVGRFLVVNALFMAFTPIHNHVVVFGRQVLLWIVMVASPTPGGSGISEFAFKEYYNDIALGTGPILVITLIWRIISYYLYLLAGIMVIPKWIRKSFVKAD